MTQPSRVLEPHPHVPGRRSREPARSVIERCRGGDRDALRELFDAFGARVFGGDDARARDVTQDVFVKVMERIAGFEGASCFSTWLYRLTVNACLDQRRSDLRLVSHTDPLDAAAPPDETAPQSVALDLREASDLVARAVSDLTPPLRAVILLRYFEGLSYDEMAETLGCAPGTVASRLNRAHAALADALAVLRDREEGTRGAP